MYHEPICVAMCFVGCDASSGPQKFDFDWKYISILECQIDIKDLA